MLVSRRLHLMPSVFSPGKPAIAKAPMRQRPAKAARADGPVAKKLALSPTEPTVEHSARTLVIRDVGIAGIPNDLMELVVARRSILAPCAAVCKAWRDLVGGILADFKERNICWWSGSRRPRSFELTTEEELYVTACMVDDTIAVNMSFDTMLMAHRNVPLIDVHDIRRVLDLPSDHVPNQGYLDGVAVDAFMAWVGAVVTKHTMVFADYSVKVVSSQPVYLPSNALNMARGSSDHELIGKQLAAASAIYHVMHVGSNHWAAVKIYNKHIHVFDCMGVATEAHASALLYYVSELTDDDSFLSYEVVLHSRDLHGLPVQKDGKSCGVFACIILYHLLCNARLQLTQADIGGWRKFMLAKIKAVHAVYGVTE